MRSIIDEELKSKSDYVKQVVVSLSEEKKKLKFRNEELRTKLGGSSEKLARAENEE